MASKGVNKVILIGRAGKDPEVRYSQGGMAFASISLATSESWKDKQTGEQKEKTEWHNVVFSGKLAEIVGQYVKKGSQIYVEGKLQGRKWQDSNGQDRYTTEVIVDSFNGVMQMLDGKPQEQQAAQQQKPQQQQQAYSYSQQRQQVNQQPRQQQYSEPPMNFDDDIPFAPVGLQSPQIVNCM